MSLIRRLSRRFSHRGSRPTRQRRDYSDGKCTDKDSIPCKVVLLDGSTLLFNLSKKSIGIELITLVNKNLDLVEKDYFGLQFTDNIHVAHWLDPLKRIRKQVRVGPPYVLNFHVKFYSPEPHNLSEELTRYHFFLQLKQDIKDKRLNVPLKKVVELAAYSLQSELGDYDPELHDPEYVSEFKFVPEQTHELEKEIKRRHKQFAGLNPAECEINFLKAIYTVDLYGTIQYEVQEGKTHAKHRLGLSSDGITVIKENKQVTTHSWSRLTNMTFKRNHFNIAVENKERPSLSEHFSFILPSAKASKQLWKDAVEHHSFFRLLKSGEAPTATLGLFRRGSRFRFSGRTQHQVDKEAKLSARKQMKIERTRSERYSKRSTVGYIRVGSKVWAKALNGDYYKGNVTGLGEKVHIKFNNDDTIAHERDTEDCVVFDMEPNAEDIQIGIRVIAHWPSLSAYLSGTVIKIEGQKYYVHYDDGDKGWNNIRQIRILKPPVYFGPGANSRGKIKKNESFKETSMTARAITVEKPLKAKQQLKQAKENEAKSNSTDHSQSSYGDEEQYNERKISYSSRKSSENHEEPRRNPRQSSSSSAAEKASRLDQILKSTTVATDVDTGQPVFVGNDDKTRYRQMATGQYKSGEKSSLYPTRPPQRHTSAPAGDQRDAFISKQQRPPPISTEL